MSDRCISCGSTDGPDWDGVCSQCGGRLFSRPKRMTPSNAKDDVLSGATVDQVERANAAVAVNLNADGSPVYDSAQGYACALTAIIQSDARNAKVDAVEAVTDKMIGAGWVVMSKAFGRDVPDRTIRAFYLAMRAAHVTAQEGKEDK
jgi:hypothetical protein